MRVLVVSPVAFAGSRQIGGTRTYTLGLLNSLRILGEDVWLAGLRGCNRDGRQGVVVADIDTCSTIRFLLGLCRNIISCRRLYPDVISIQLSLAGLPFLLSNVPLVVTMHGSPQQGVAARRGRVAAAVMQSMEAMVLHRAQRVIFVDERARQEYLGQLPWLSAKSVTIPVAVDIDTFHPLQTEEKKLQRVAVGLPAEGPVLVFVGRFSREKNVNGLLDSFAEFRRDQPQAVLLLIGDGPESATLISRVTSLGLDRQVVFLKGLSREEIARNLGLADLFVMASLHEGMPIAALEALACGVPLVTTDVGDLRRLVRPQVTGEVVPDVTDLAAAMQRAVGSRECPGWAFSAAEACREEALKYGWEQIVEKITAQHELAMRNSVGSSAE